MGNIAHPTDPTPEELETMTHRELDAKYGPFIDPSRIDDEILDELRADAPGCPPVLCDDDDRRN